MQRWFSAMAGALCALALVLLATAGAVKWADARGSEFVASLRSGKTPSPAVPKAAAPAEPDAQSQANAYSAAAAYLNYRYGFPIGVLTALIGGVVTAFGGFLGWRLTNRQGDVEILKFIEDKISPAIKHQQRLTAAVGDLLQWGNAARPLAMRLKTRIEDEGGPADSPLFALLQEVGDAFDRGTDVREPNSASIPSENTMLADEAIEAVLALFELTRRLGLVFDDVTENMYSYFFFRLEAQRVPESQRPLKLLAERLPDTARQYPSLFGDGLPDLAVSLSYFALATRPLHLVGAAYSLPKENLTLEFLGHVIFSLAATPYHLVERNDALVARYNYNFGAAYLITVVQAMPCKATIVAAFEQMFGDRSAVAKKFIQGAVPEKAEMGPSIILTSLAESLTNPGRLITAEVLTEGPQSLSVRGELYQRGRHGPAPVASDPGEPQNKKGAALASRALSGSVRP